MTTLVTGASGFVGAAVARALAARERPMRLMLRPSSDKRNLAGLKAEVVQGDLTDPVSLKAALKGCRRVFHVAADYRLWARDPASLYRTNVEGSQTFGANTVAASVDWLAGLRARAGFFVTPDILLFGTIGAGWADIDLPTTGAGGGAGSEVFSGIQYGAGTELALSDRWSLRMDYLYTDLDSETITYPGGNTTSYDPDIHQFRAGLQLRF